MTQRVEICGTQRITYTQAWDVDNRMVAITSSLGYTATYVYDADGQRVKRMDTIGTLLIVGAHFEVQARTGISTSYYFFDGQRVAMRQNSAVYWLHGDHLGSASLTTNITGAVVSEMRYYPFGETRWVSGTIPSDRTFTGQRSENPGIVGSLMDYGARMYSPSLRRFISADTIVPRAGDAQAFNRYAYARNSPVMRVDPNGNTDCDAGKTQCWIDAYVAQHTWYQQMNLEFRWLEGTNIAEKDKLFVEDFYRQLLDDPLEFAKLFVEFNNFSKSDESTNLVVLLTETSLSSHGYLPDAFAQTIVSARFGDAVANVMLLTRGANSRRDPAIGFRTQVHSQGVDVLLNNTLILTQKMLTKPLERSLANQLGPSGYTADPLVQLTVAPASYVTINSEPSRIYHRAEYMGMMFYHAPVLDPGADN